MSLSNPKSEKVKTLLQEALDGVHQAESSWVESPLDFTTKAELASFAHELEQMLKAVDVQEKRDVPGLWRIVTDMWPYTNHLRQKIVEAELAFEKLQ